MGEHPRGGSRRSPLNWSLIFIIPFHFIPFHFISFHGSHRSLCTSHAELGTFGIFVYFQLRKKWFFCIFLQANSLFLHQSANDMIFAFCLCSPFSHHCNKSLLCNVTFISSTISCHECCCSSFSIEWILPGAGAGVDFCHHFGLEITFLALAQGH